jgi:DNA repair exonuclease SbcCD ATPase subunit
MKKSIIIGLATLAVTGSAIIGSSIYAASSNTMQKGNHMSKMQRMEANITLSGVSTEAQSAFTVLQTKHKTEMDTLRTQTGVTQEQIQAKHEAFKTEMDTLITKYPELKTAIQQGGKMGRENPIDNILSGLSDADKTAVKAIHDEYQTKHEALRIEEKTKMDTIIAKYPDIKAKLDTMEKSRSQMGQDGGRGEHGPRGR